MDDFISLPVEVPLIKNSEECAGKPNTGTKLKKKDAPMQQTVPVLHEAEQKGPILEAFAPFNLPLSLPPKREGAAGGMATGGTSCSFRKHEEEGNTSAVPEEMKGTYGLKKGEGGDQKNSVRQNTQSLPDRLLPALGNPPPPKLLGGPPPPAETKQNEKPREGKFGSFSSLGLSLYITSLLLVVL